jgi:hypothetical protein
MSDIKEGRVDMNERRDTIPCVSVDVPKQDEATIASYNAIALETCMKTRIDEFKRMCFLLKECKDNKYYKLACDSWAEYVASTGLTLTKANKMVRFAQVYGAILKHTDDAGGRYDVESLGSTDEDRLLSDWLPCVKYNKTTGAIEDIENAVELLGQAKALSYSDFQAVKDQHKQVEQHPEVQPVLAEGPVLDENKNVIGNYRTTKATGKQHYFSIGILDEYIKANEGQEIKVSLGK